MNVNVYVVWSIDGVLGNFCNEYLSVNLVDVFSCYTYDCIECIGRFLSATDQIDNLLKGV